MIWLKWWWKLSRLYNKRSKCQSRSCGIFLLIKWGFQEPFLILNWLQKIATELTKIFLWNQLTRFVIFESLEFKNSDRYYSTFTSESLPYIMLFDKKSIRVSFENSSYIYIKTLKLPRIIFYLGIQSSKNIKILEGWIMSKPPSISFLLILSLKKLFNPRFSY